MRALLLVTVAMSTAQAQVQTPGPQDIPQPVPGDVGLAGSKLPDIARYLNVRTASSPSLSPDGRWLAYTSDESGRGEIYVTPFPQAASKWQVSMTGGTSPRWRNDGKELFYLSADSKLMAAEVDTSGTIFQVGVVRPLFQALLRTGPSRFELSSTSEQIVYDASPDGTWYIVNSPPAGDPPPITLITNWSAEPKRR